MPLPGEPPIFPLLILYQRLALLSSGMALAQITFQRCWQGAVGLDPGPAIDSQDVMGGMRQAVWL